MRIALLCLLSFPVVASADDFKLNNLGYFQNAGIDVMYGQDYYP
jgi:hypothetical protein